MEIGRKTVINECFKRPPRVLATPWWSITSPACVQRLNLQFADTEMWATKALLITHPYLVFTLRWVLDVDEIFHIPLYEGFW